MGGGMWLQKPPVWVGFQVGFGEFIVNLAVSAPGPRSNPGGSDGSRFQAGPEQLRARRPLEALMKAEGDEWLRLKAFWR